MTAIGVCRMLGRSFWISGFNTVELWKPHWDFGVYFWKTLIEDYS
jgi:hypothetical protein